MNSSVLMPERGGSEDEEQQSVSELELNEGRREGGGGGEPIWQIEAVALLEATLAWRSGALRVPRAPIGEESEGKRKGEGSRDPIIIQGYKWTAQ